MSAEADDVSAMLGQSAADWLGGLGSRRGLQGPLGAVRPVQRSLRADMAGLGWIGLGLPPALGGLGLGLREALVLCDAFGRHAFPEPYVATVVMPEAVLALAAEHPAAGGLATLHRAAARWLTLAWQEQAADDGSQAPHTRLEGQRLHGAKCFVPAVEADTVLLVSAVQGHETVLVAVDADAPGLTVRPTAAGDGVSLARLRFDGTPVRAGGVLLAGPAARHALARALAAGTLGSAAQLAGLASGCIEKTVAYVNGRRQFERAIGSFQSVQHRLVDLYTAQRLASASWRHALKCFEGGDADDADGKVGDQVATSAATIAAISAAKARCADAAVQAGRLAVQLHGAMGFTEEADIGAYLRAAFFHAAWLGNAGQHRRRFAAGLAPEPLIQN